MRLIHISSLTVEDRQRSDMKPRGIIELRDDIIKNGLYHPLVVEKLDEDKYRLLAGERRLRAVEGITARYKCGQLDVPAGYIPITLFEELSAEQQVEIELHENLLRADLTWQEQEAAIAKLHALRRLQHPSQTITDTAKELASVKTESVAAAKNRVSRALLIEAHKNDPTVKNARSANEAHQAVIKNLEAEVLNKLAKKKKHTSPHRFIQADLRDALLKLEKVQFDVIIADPPYGMGADSFGSTTTKHHYEDDAEASIALASIILSEGFILTKPDAFLFLFCDIEHFVTLRNTAKHCGWQTWRTPLIWDKSSPTGIEPLPGRGFFRNYELILYCLKGERARSNIISDVIRVPKISVVGHSAAKPPDLYRILLSRSGNPGDTVLDPCCGIGTVFTAARLCNWIATGIELDASCAARAEAASRGLDL